MGNGPRRGWRESPRHNQLDSVRPRSPGGRSGLAELFMIGPSSLTHLNVDASALGGNCCCELLTAPGRVMAMTLFRKPWLGMKHADHTGPFTPAARRKRSIDVDGTGSVVAMHQRHCLPVAAKKSPLSTLAGIAWPDRRKSARERKRYPSSGQHHGDLEGSAGSHRGGLRSKRKVHAGRLRRRCRRLGRGGVPAVSAAWCNCSNAAGAAASALWPGTVPKLVGAGDGCGGRAGLEAGFESDSSWDLSRSVA